MSRLKRWTWIISVLLLIFLVFTSYQYAEGQIKWTKYEGNPVLDLGSSGEWDDYYVYAPSVLFEDGVYKMWYSGLQASSRAQQLVESGKYPGFSRIGYATSTDGIVWTKYKGNPVLDLGADGEWDDIHVYSPSVLFEDGVYKMWYTGYDGYSYRIGYATSLDGIVWTKYKGNPVLDLGSPGEWDDGHVSGPSVLFEDGTYKMWYPGSGYNWRFRIGYATSTDGIVWTKYEDNEGNPVLSWGEPDAWDSYRVFCPSVLFEDGTYKMWYTGYDGSTLRIGYATSGVVSEAFKPVFSVAGTVRNADSSLAEDGLEVVVSNETKGLTATTTVGEQEHGRYGVVFVSTENKPVATEGDTLKVAVKCSEGNVLSSQTYKLNSEDIAKARATVDVTLLSTTTNPVFTIVGTVKNADGSLADDGLEVAVSNETKGLTATTTVGEQEHGRYGVVFVSTENKPVAVEGDTLKVTVKSEGNVLGSQTYKLTSEDIAKARATVDVTLQIALCKPTLIAPGEGAVLDNGRTDSLDDIIWDFDWSDCEGATQYHLFVKYPGAGISPVIDDDTIKDSSYHSVSPGSYIAEQNRHGWTWKVRAKIGGQWGEWSETRTFDVEPLNTDPPRKAKILSVPYYAQGDLGWCLPTSMAMILKYYGYNIHSWDIAEYWGWSRDDPPKLKFWDAQFWQQQKKDALQYFNNKKYFNNPELRTEEESNAKDFDAIKGWINKGMPVLFSVIKPFVIGHVVVIVGYSVVDGSKKVYINDPSGALVNDKMHKGVTPPVAVEVCWDDVAKYIGLFSYLIAIGQKEPPLPSPPKGTIDLRDGGVNFGGASGILNIWLYGLDKGLIWKRSPSSRPLSLNSEDRFQFSFDNIVNHTKDDQTYGFEIKFDSGEIEEARISLTVPVEHRKRALMPEWDSNILASPVKELLPDYGEYTITLTLFDETFTEEYDKIVFPPIEYKSLPSLERLDVNGNGVIDVFDLVIVGKNFGKTGDNIEGDVNNDGVVNVFDLVLLGSHFGEKAAPALHNVSLLQRIYDILKTEPNPNSNLKMALKELKKLLAPSETVLLQNYPNPFNPETWIPFELAERSEASITIYDAIGRIIRTLKLGELPAGIYLSKDKAAHWDGRNQYGEKVPSGVYFYQLQAGDFTATKKLVILK